MSRPSASPRRFLHLWLPSLPTDRARLAQGDSSSTPAPTPLALIAKVKGALRLQALDEAASRQGLRVGMTLADARAAVPDLRVQDADPGADMAFLKRLASSHRRYTPALALAAPDGLDLDITGATGLFGGEGRLAEDLSSRLSKAGVAGRLGVGDTPALAFALARFGPAGVTCVIAPEGERASALGDLPVAALGLDSDSTVLLERLGLRRIGQILDMPRSALMRRFGDELLHRLDEALGLRASPLSLRLERPPVLAERRLAEGVTSEAAILQLIDGLAQTIDVELELRGLGGRRFVLELFRVDGAVRRLEVAASRPLRDPGRITALFTDRLARLNEGLEADFGFDVLRLWGAGVQTFVPQALDLLEGGREDGAFAELLDRISARDGLEVKRLIPRDAHRPQASPMGSFSEPGGALKLDGAYSQDGWKDETPLRFADVPLRPLRLFSPPQPIEEVMAEAPEGPPVRFLWRRVWRHVVRAEGPERIEPEAGDGPAERTRDYYRLEDEPGLRYWVFRQGLYGEAEPPHWRLHGLFG